MILFGELLEEYWNISLLLKRFKDQLKFSLSNINVFYDAWTEPASGCAFWIAYICHAALKSEVNRRTLAARNF